ncbi:MAG TPA: alpha/beta fold hydrolase [Anaerolineales bacterium]
MPAVNDTTLIEFCEWTLRLRPAAASPARLLLMIHGFTGDENSMWVFAHDLPPDTWVLAPRAPFASEPFGYSWRPFADGDSSRTSLEMLQPSIEALIGLVDAYSASVGLDVGQFDVMGFSQGAALAALLAMQHPSRVARLALLAGFVPRGAEDLIASRPLSGKRVFVAHGTQDNLVPVERARRSVELLEQAGAQVTYCEAEVGHKLSLDCMRALRVYLQE